MLAPNSQDSSDEMHSDADRRWDRIAGLRRWISQGTPELCPSAHPAVSESRQPLSEYNAAIITSWEYKLPLKWYSIHHHYHQTITSGYVLTFSQILYFKLEIAKIKHICLVLVVARHKHVVQQRGVELLTRLVGLLFSDVIFRPRLWLTGVSGSGDSDGRRVKSGNSVISPSNYKNKCHYEQKLTHLILRKSILNIHCQYVYWFGWWGIDDP